MHPHRSISPSLWSIIDDQAGVVSRQQALDHVASRSIQRFVAEGFWQPLGRGLYATERKLGWVAWAWAGLLLGGPLAVVGGTAALHLHGVLEDEPSAIGIFTPRRVAPFEHLHFVRALRRGRGEPSRALIDDALLDGWRDMTSGDFLIAFGRACQRRLTTPARLQAALAERGRVPRRRELLSLLDDGRVGVRSPLERDYRRNVEVAHDLPAPDRQARTAGGESDIWYRRWGVVIELDGRRGHEEGRFRDMRRDNRNTAQGLITLRFGWADVHDRPCEAALQVAAALRSRGWPGSASPCPRCRLQHAS